MHISTRTQDHVIRALAGAFAYFLCLIAFYINIGQDMGPGYFLPILVPVVTGLCLMQYGTHIYLFSLENLPNLITGLGWCSASPLLYTWTYSTPWYMSKICFDFVVGTGIFLLLTSLEGLLMQTRQVKLMAALMALLNLICLAVPITQYAYYIMVWHCLSPASLMALYLTNWRESIDFLQSNVGLGWLFLIGLGFAFFLCLAWKAHCAFGRRILSHRMDWERNTVLALLMGAMIFLVPFQYLPQTSIAELWTDVSDYVSQTQEYGAYFQQRYSTLNIDEQNALPALMENPGTVILVIGESASRDYMKSFTPDFPYDDTPWLSRQAEESPDFLLFQNCYSSWSQTVPALQRALTEQSQYNSKEFVDACSIIDVARKSGYETWWFSNQGRYGQYDSVITLVAKGADHAEWTDDSYMFSDKYDMVLMDYLKKVDPSKNNFSVLHIMGSHIYYNNRYPSDFTRWKAEDGAGMATSVASYANSILYTDFFLSQIFDYARQNLNLTAMLYFSDHGENLVISHNPDVFSFDMVRIPMFVYLSPEYRERLPDQSRLLRQRHNRYFTNDMLYDTLCGLLNAPSDRYESRQDLTSPDYGFTRENLTTMLGQHSLTEDPNGPPEGFF